MVNTAARGLYEQEVVRRLLGLREDLVRHDENLAAWRLMDECVPYFLRDHPEVVSARDDQREMVAHLLDPAAYLDFYRTNPGERPFEEQYGLPVEDAHRIHRVGFLRGELQLMAARQGAAGRKRLATAKEGGGQ